MKKVFAFLLVLCVAFSLFGTFAYADELSLSAVSAILIEAETGTVLYSKNADEQRAMASTTKIMTAILTIEAGDLDREFTVDPYAIMVEGTSMGLREGDIVSRRDLLYGILLPSGNDAANAAAVSVAGSISSFVSKMNEKAEQLGLEKTHFVTPSGLDAEGHLTTAYDVAVMSKELIKHQLVKQYSTVWMDSLRDGESELVNTNKLVRFYKGTTGLKTGTTSIAKYCLSATAEREGMELVAVVMAGDSSTDRFEGAKKLLDFGFANFKNSVLDGNLKETEIDVKKGVLKTVQIECNDTVSVLLKKGASAEIKREIVWNEDITAPIKKGDVLGYVNIYMEETQVGALKITAKEPVKKLTVMYAVLEIFKEIFQI